MDVQGVMENAVGVDAAALAWSWRGIVCLAIFVVAYAAVMTEELHGLRKSKPVILAAGAIWAVIAMGVGEHGVTDELVHESIMHGLMEFSGLFLFLLASMTYINAMNERNVFAALRWWVIERGWNYRRLFWATGALAFVLSAMVDNLISALLMGAVIMALGKASNRFVMVACVNVVVAANAGGAFSPFGDITTLMMWQSGHITFFEFFELFPASLVTWLVPAVVMSWSTPKGVPEMEGRRRVMKRGAKRICGLFFVTIATAVTFEHFLHLPPFMGMMTGVSLLMMFTHYVKISAAEGDDDELLDIYREVGRAEWDTLLFFFGVIFAVGGLGVMGHLTLLSGAMYGGMGASWANIFAGVLSAVVDNIPVMFSILQMEPEMSHFQWMLITLTIGVGGSLLSVGSAAGVGLMGVTRGRYTFGGHLRFTPVIALGYGAGIGVHFLLGKIFLGSGAL